MSEQSDDPTSPLLMLFAADSPAKTSATPGSGRVSAVRVLASGPNTPELFASFDPITSSWRTSQGSLTGGSASFLGTWPRSGTMRSGRCYRLAPWVHHTHASACSWWPTPRASDRDNCGGANARRAAHRNGTYVGRLLNPRVSEWLMGFRFDWSALPLSEMLSSPMSRKSSDG